MRHHQPGPAGRLETPIWYLCQMATVLVLTSFNTEPGPGAQTNRSWMKTIQAVSEANLRIRPASGRSILSQIAEALWLEHAPDSTQG